MPAPVLPIRRLGPRDAVLDQVWERVERSGLCEEVGSRVELALFAACNDRGVWAAVDGGAVASYATARVLRDRDLDELGDVWPGLGDRGVTTGWVWLLAAETTPVYRRRGLHRALIDTRVRWAARLGAPGAIVLSWRHRGATSTGQLHVAGFRDIATIAGYFAGDDADVTLMARTFTCDVTEDGGAARSTTPGRPAPSGP